MTNLYFQYFNYLNIHLYILTAHPLNEGVKQNNLTRSMPKCSVYPFC